MGEALYLIYVHVIGMDRKGVSMYEFIFSNTTDNIDGEDWDAIPASGRPSPPHEDLVRRVGVLTTDEITFHVIQESDSFSVWDAIDGVIALAWENMDDYVEYPDSRTAFHFGDKIEDVEAKLYENDLILKYNKEENGKFKEEDK
jgi:hypothetical protein